MVDPRLPDAERVAALREALPATGAGIYLDTATRGPLPAETAAAMREADEWELRVGRATAGRDEDAAARAEEARAVLAALITAEPREIALCPGLDSALSVAASALDWQPGDRAVATSHEGPAVRAALAGLHHRFGVQTEILPLDDDRDAGAVTAALETAVDERTRLLMLSHVAPASGLRMPVEAAAELARQRGAWLAVDASQSAGALPVAAEDLGADFLAVAGETWPLGPEGTAALWLGPRALRDGRPALSGSAAYETLPARGVPRGWPDARRFEPLALPRTTLLGLGRSIGWLEMYVGLEWALERAARLARRLHGSLAAVPGVELLTPARSMGTIVSFRLRGWSGGEIADELGRRVFALVRPLPELDAVRASACWFNTEDELDRFSTAVSELAAHTPASLPRRPALVVLPATATEQDGR